MIFPTGFSFYLMKYSRASPVVPVVSMYDDNHALACKAQFPARKSTGKISILPAGVCFQIRGIQLRTDSLLRTGDSLQAKVSGSRSEDRPANHACRLCAGSRRIRAGRYRSRSVRIGSENPQDFHSLPTPRLCRANPDADEI